MPFYLQLILIMLITCIWLHLQLLLPPNVLTEISNASISIQFPNRTPFYDLVILKMTCILGQISAFEVNIFCVWVYEISYLLSFLVVVSVLFSVLNTTCSFSNSSLNRNCMHVSYNSFLFYLETSFHTYRFDTVYIL